MSINENKVEVHNYRGPVRPCEFCKNATLPPPLRIHCKFCLTNGYLAKCLSCAGTGNVTGVAPWDGTSKHSSVCNICGGQGTLPARIDDFKAQSPEIRHQAINEAKRPLMVTAAGDVHERQVVESGEQPKEAVAT